MLLLAATADGNGAAGFFTLPAEDGGVALIFGAGELTWWGSKVSRIRRPTLKASGMPIWKQGAGMTFDNSGFPIQATGTRMAAVRGTSSTSESPPAVLEGRRLISTMAMQLC